MRGTGSNDIMLEGVFIPDAAMGGVRRPPNKWHASVHAVTLNALPIVYGAYVGVAEAARDLAIEIARKKKEDPGLPYVIGEMENQLVTAQVTLASAVAMVTTAKPGPQSTSAMLVRRTIIGNAVLRTLDKAMEVAGGASFFRTAKLERLFRDIQASRFHPLPEKQQTRLTGRLLLGLELDG
jgi:acyl-CoA dehydrogenase